MLFELPESIAQLSRLPECASRRVSELAIWELGNANAAGAGMVPSTWPQRRT